jgi:mutator protein MutT
MIKASFMKKEVSVSAVYMKDGSKVFLSQRPIDKPQGGKWEFFGGKLEENESFEEAAVRESKEELNLDIKIEDLKYFDEIKYEYEKFILNMKLFEATKWDGVPEKLEVADFAWVDVNNFDEIDFIEADIELMEKLRFNILQGH